MYKNTFIGHLIDEPKEKKLTERDILFGPLTDEDRYSTYDIFDDFEMGDRSERKIGEYQEIFDPCAGGPRYLVHLVKFYNKDILLRLRKELKDCENPASMQAESFISDELYQDMKKIYDVRRPPDEQKPTRLGRIEIKKSKRVAPKIESKKSSASSTVSPHDEKYFLKTPRKLIRNKNYRETFKGRGTVWEWLQSKIIRKGWNDTKGYPLKEKYFDNGFLVCSYSIGKIAEKCGLAKASVSKYLKIFEEAGVIRIENLERNGKRNGQSVYILGEWRYVDGKYREFLYRDTTFD